MCASSKWDGAKLEKGQIVASHCFAEDARGRAEESDGGMMSRRCAHDEAFTAASEVCVEPLSRLLGMVSSVVGRCVHKYRSTIYLAHPAACRYVAEAWVMWCDRGPAE